MRPSPINASADDTFAISNRHLGLVSQRRRIIRSADQLFFRSRYYDCCRRIQSLHAQRSVNRAISRYKRDQSRKWRHLMVSTSSCLSSRGERGKHGALVKQFKPLCVRAANKTLLPGIWRREFWTHCCQYCANDVISMRHRHWSCSCDKIMKKETIEEAHCSSRSCKRLQQCMSLKHTFNVST